jgi:hypothetical protein
LEVIGGGLFEGSPREWDVSRPTVAAVSPEIGRAVASRIEVAVSLLGVGIDGRLGEREEGLRGLGYVSVDRTAAAAIETALLDGSPNLPSTVVDGGSLSPLPTVAVPAAYLAVQEYGHRLAHALDGFEAKQRAENNALLWDWTFGLPTSVASEFTRRTGPGLALGLGIDYLAIGVGADGTWDNPADEGLRFTRADAVDQLRTRAALRIDADALARQAEAAFDRTATALGIPAPPRSPDVDLMAPIRDAVVGEAASWGARKGVDGVREFIGNR